MLVVQPVSALVLRIFSAMRAGVFSSNLITCPIRFSLRLVSDQGSAFVLLYKSSFVIILGHLIWSTVRIRRRWNESTCLMWLAVRVQVSELYRKILAVYAFKILILISWLVWCCVIQKCVAAAEISLHLMLESCVFLCLHWCLGSLALFPEVSVSIPSCLLMCFLLSQVVCWLSSLVLTVTQPNS